MNVETYKKVGYDQCQISDNLEDYVGRMNGIFAVMDVDPEMSVEDKDIVIDYLRNLKVPNNFIRLNIYY